MNQKKKTSMLHATSPNVHSASIEDPTPFDRQQRFEPEQSHIRALRPQSSQPDYPGPDAATAEARDSRIDPGRK
jgi:hypothetical protein